jgi:DNA-binding transcriptional LysR family regulator
MFAHISRIPVFIMVAQEQSFAGAARRLGITGSAVSKQVQILEDELQVKLLNRTTRQVSLTEEGAAFLDKAKQAMDVLSDAREDILDMKSTLRGPLKVSLPQDLGRTYLSESIAQFAARNPEVSLNVSFDDRFVDPVNDEFDLVVRIGTLKDSGLIARRLASCPFVLCASPDYLERAGMPETPDDLIRHNMLAYVGNSMVHEWRYTSAAGKREQLNLSGSFRSDSGDMLCRAAIEGVGIAILPAFYVAQHLSSGQLQHLLPEYETWPLRDIHAVFQPNPHPSARLRAFLDHLIETCRALPWE